MVAIAVIANLQKLEDGEETGGQTSEAAALLTYALGALLAIESYAAAIVVGGVTAVLLHFKRPLHEFAGDMSERDIRAVMRFVIVTLIILPLLPDQTYGPYGVLNPREIWWMVVLIVGIGLSGYVTYKLFRGRAGVVLGGILGGLVSSTATILVAALANVAFKAGVVFFLGSPKLFVKILPVFGAAFAGGVAILLAWPG